MTLFWQEVPNSEVKKLCRSHNSFVLVPIWVIWYNPRYTVYCLYVHCPYVPLIHECIWHVVYWLYYKTNQVFNSIVGGGKRFSSTLLQKTQHESCKCVHCGPYQHYLPEAWTEFLAFSIHRWKRKWVPVLGCIKMLTDRSKILPYTAPIMRLCYWKLRHVVSIATKCPVVMRYQGSREKIVSITRIKLTTINFYFLSL